MYCSNCGAPIPPYNSFCPSCGYEMIENFDIGTFKTRAKSALRQKYWPAFLVSLIATVLTGGLDIYNRFSSSTGSHSYDSYGYGIPPAFYALLLSLAGFFGVIALIYTIFVANPIEAGSSSYYLKNHEGRSTIVDVFYAFKSERYLKIVGAMAWRSLFTFLWTLLFIIPGIVKYYAYCLVPYIMAEHPDIGYKEALRLSMEMTRGHKGDIFVLQLSFIGWYLLGALCLGVGVLFVQPYFEATMAEMFVSIRNNAVKSGLYPSLQQ